jgi:hypothetical protein
VAATNAENAGTSYAQITAQIALVTATLGPNITVDGVTIDRAGYYRTLLELQKAALAALVAAQGPFTICSVAR